MKKHSLTSSSRLWLPFDSKKYRTQSDLTKSVTESHKRLATAIENLPFFFAFLDEHLAHEPKTNEHCKELIRTYISKRLEATDNPPKSIFLNLGNECLALREQIDQVLPNFWEMIINFDVSQLSEAAFEQASHHSEFEAQKVILKNKIATRTVLEGKKA